VSRRRRERKQTAEINLLDLAPRRLAAWEEVGEQVVLERPRPSPRGVRGFFEWLSYHSAVRKLRLDPIGGCVWKLLDGETTVGQAAQAVRERFGAPSEPAEERVALFVQQLHREGLLAFPGLDDR